MNQACNTIVASLLAQEEATHGVRFLYSTSWSLPTWIWATVGGAVVILMLFLYWNERGPSKSKTRLVLLGLRCALMALVSLALLGWNQTGFETEFPDLVVVLDDTLSMNHVDLPKEGESASADSSASPETRIQRVVSLLHAEQQQLLRRLKKQYNLKFYLAGETARRWQVKSEGELPFENLKAQQAFSRLGLSIREILAAQRGRPTAGMLVFTDGITTEGPKISEIGKFARQRQIPFFLVGVGDDRPQVDLKLSDLLVDDAAFVGDLVTFDLQLSTYGIESGQTKLSLRLQGQSDFLVEQNVDLDEGTQRIQIQYQVEEEGEFEFELSIEALDDELDVANNSLRKKIQVRDETINVLLVQYEPSYEYRYLKQLFGRQLKLGPSQVEKNVNLTTLLQSSSFRFSEIDETASPVFPVKQEDLFQYDVVIFGDVMPSYLGDGSGALSTIEMSSIVEFVKTRGGGVVIIAGPNFTPSAFGNTPMAQLFPFPPASVTQPSANQNLTQETKLAPTPIGASLPSIQLDNSPTRSTQIWGQLDGVYWFLRIQKLKPGVMVLAKTAPTEKSAVDFPLITMQHVGRGSVVFHAFDESYRWNQQAGENYFERYWNQTLRLLSRRKLLNSKREVELSTSQPLYEFGDEVSLRVRFFDDLLLKQEFDADVNSGESQELVQITLSSKDGFRQTFVGHRQSSNRLTYEALVSELRPGEYRARLTSPFLDSQSPTAEFVVLAPLSEIDRVQMNSADLQLAAQESKGKYAPLEKISELIDELPTGRQVNVAARPPVVLWNDWRVSTVFAMVFLILITSEWILRRKLGML